MYHYVRDLVHTRFTGVRGRSIDEFRFQIDYLKKTGTFITSRQLVDAVANGTNLPDNAVMVSFDDGYLDHYTNVLPILHDRQIEGLFFPTVEPILKHKVMNVNKIQFILACEPDASKLVEEIKFWVGESNGIYALPDTEELWKESALSARFETVESFFVKSVLQRRLPKAARSILTDYLFHKHVTQDEHAFAEELYMSPEQLRMMHQCGQYIGSHGYSHEWLDLLEPEGQAIEIQEPLRFLSGLGIPVDNWIMCYPYGGYPHGAIDVQLRNALVEHGCALALISHGGKANLEQDDRFMIRRLDTNDVSLNRP